jgi:circadian clock protein KaiC
MVAGPSGSGKTIMGLHSIYGGAGHGECGIIATLQENPTQLDRMRTGLGWPAADPPVQVMYRSPVDIYIDEWVHDLLEAVERTQARRVLIDSLMDLQMAALDDTRFRESCPGVVSATCDQFLITSPRPIAGRFSQRSHRYPSLVPLALNR